MEIVALYDIVVRVGGVAPSWAVTNVSISNSPLAGIGSVYGPNIVLALSVEYPTAGPAYFSEVFQSGDPQYNRQITDDPYIIKDSGKNYSAERLDGDRMTHSNLGYFDYSKCYTYVTDSTDSSKGYFKPTSKDTFRFADSSNTWGYWGNCKGENEFSGSALNFLTMTAVDIFRQAMTGGNRAFSTSLSSDSYQTGDTASETYLRRARVIDSQNGKYMNSRYVYIKSLNNFGLWEGSFPKKIRDAAAKWANGNYHGVYLTVENKDFGFEIKVGKLQLSNGKPVQSNGLGKWANGPTSVFTGNVVVKVCDKDNTAAGLESNCVKQPDGNYKPEGLLQEYAKANSGNTAMRLAVLGYLQDSSDIDGGVLRARMKTLISSPKLKKAKGESPTIQVGDEWDSNTGVFAANPDADDARDSGVDNSGVVNYINKFGDKDGYKTRDPAAELYYTAYRYLRHGAWKWKDGVAGGVQEYNSTPDTIAPYKHSGLTPEQKDGFPVIDKWEDPLFSTPGAQCRSNTILLIGDTNTHNDWNLPHFNYNADLDRQEYGTYENTKATKDLSPISDDNVNTEQAMKKAIDNQGSTWTRGRYYRDINGIWPYYQHSPAGIVGLAYWGRNFDMRPDIEGDQFPSNFMIDVSEPDPDSHMYAFKGGSRTGMENTYYLAAKYGGFDRTLAGSKDADGYLNPDPYQEAWTDDPAGNSITTYQHTETSKIFKKVFENGVPRNFGVANTPENMVQSLKRAMAVAGAQTDVSQTDFSTVNNDTQTVDLGENGNNNSNNNGNNNGNLVVRSMYDASKWLGDVLIYSTSARTVDNKTTGLNFTQVWSLGGSLSAAYHNATGYATRNVWTWNGSAAVKFNTALGTEIQEKIATSNAADIIKYTLGDPSLEAPSGSLRKRGSILGTIVNSQVVGFQYRPTTSGSTTNNSTTDNVQQFFAVASNEGMLHIFKVNKNSNGALSGSEVFAYLPSTALPGLAEYANKGYQHRFLNDGMITVKTLKVGNENKTYLVGSTGRGDSKGKGAVYAVDVTNPNQPQLLWEYTDTGLGHVLGEPVVTLDALNQPVAIVGSGYNTEANDGYLYVLKLSTLAVQKVKLGSANVGAVFGYDSNSDGKTDRIYVGDDSGKLWRVDNTVEKGSDDKDTSVWKSPYSNNNATAALYVPEPADERPITGTPYVQNVGGRVYVLAGTGRYLSDSDLSATQQNYAYGFFDTCSGTGTNCTTVKKSELLEQSVKSAATTLTAYQNISLREVTDNDIQSGQRGWRVKLLPGMLIAGHANIEQKRIAAFPVVNQTPIDADACSAYGDTSGLYVDLFNGGQYSKPIFDTNGDGVVDGNDKPGALLTKHNMMNPEKGILHTTKGDFAFASVDGDGGVQFKVITKRKPRVRRMSWRELFSY